MARKQLVFLTSAIVTLALAQSMSATPTAQSERGSLAAVQQSCAPHPVVPIGDAFFRDISAASGIQDQNYVPNPATPIPANDHSRLAFVDINGDGFDDVVTTNMVDAELKKPFEHLIYLNRGDGTFRNASDESGLRWVSSAFLAFGDVDNDGDEDCFAGTDKDPEGKLGLQHALLLNDGQGHFTVKSNSGLEGVPGEPHMAGSAVFADFDADSRLDLYLANGATGAALADQFFLGHGDGTFHEASDRLAQRIERPSNGSVACDYDNDGDLDVFVAVYGVSHQYGHNVLWENDGTGHFQNVARERGFEALATGNYWLVSTGRGRDPEPVPQERWVGGNGFGLSCEDVNQDGNLDIWLANISHPDSGDYRRRWSDPSQLLINQGPAGGYAFVNRYLDANIPFNEGDLEGGVADFDNDSRLDLSMSRENKYEARYTTEEQMGWFGLFHQLPGLTFESVGMRSGINDPSDPAVIPRMKAAHSNVWADIEHDGDLDLLVGGLHKGGDGRPNFLFRNEIGSQNAWLAFRLTNDTSDFNRDAIGARLVLEYADRVLVRELKASRGMYNSADTRWLHVGLGDLGCPRAIVVRWPNGKIYRFPGNSFGQNRFVTLGYGEGTFVPTPSATPTAVAWPTDTPTPETSALGHRLYLPETLASQTLGGR